MISNLVKLSTRARASMPNGIVNKGEDIDK